MPNPCVYKDLGNIPYADAYRRQESLFNAKLEFRLGKSKEDCPDHLLFCEHNPVYTLGKSGDIRHLLQQSDAEFFKTDRGGDITYHGPGQITGYPILDLESLHLSLAEYIYKLEEGIIYFLDTYSIPSGRIKSAAGVWLDAEDPLKARKICAVGVRSSRYITMHGFAFNVNTDLTYFNNIVPCGISDKGVTSLAKELGHPLDFEKVKLDLRYCLGKKLGLGFTN